MIALAVDLCNSVAVTLFGIALSAAFCNIHWTPKAKKRMLLYTLMICCSSTFKKKDGTLESRIRPTLENGSVVTDARPCAHWFVTEYGKVNLKGLTAWQRAEALISVAHPDFREQLIQEAEKMRIWKRSNKR